MSLQEILEKRSGKKCELCSQTSNLSIFDVSGDGLPEHSILICSTCKEQIEDRTKLNPNHWRCLNESIWSEVDAVKIISYRLLHLLNNENWAVELMDMAYIEDDLKKIALEGLKEENSEQTIHKDSNGAILKEGDTITLIKDLDVKGAGFTAKRGTVVKNIHLTDNPKYIEGKINGTQIVLIAEYTKKSS